MKIPSYKHKRILRRINDGKDVPSLFDTPLKLNPGRYICYSGTVAGLPARIFYNENFQYVVSAQTPEDLDRIYNTIINKLLGSNPHPNGNGNRSLAEILGIKQ